MSKSGVSVAKIVELLDLKVFTHEINLKRRKITKADINRPAIQLTGFFEAFSNERVQIIGNVECYYMESLATEVKRERIKELLSYDIPCIIFCRDHKPSPEFLEIAEENGHCIREENKKKIFEFFGVEG